MCWGRRFIPSAPISTPTAVSGGLTFQSISIAGSNACAIAVGGAIYCWAVNDPNSTPTVVPGGLTFTQLTTGVRICAISSGTAYCWGGTAGLPPTPTAMTVPGTPVITALGSSADDSNSCLVATTGDAFCLGPNGSGQVGDGTTSPRTSPTAVSGGLSFKAIANGATHTCGLSTTDVVYCWGGTSVGALGDGSLTSSRLTPFQITLPP